MSEEPITSLEVAIRRRIEREIEGLAIFSETVESGSLEDFRIRRIGGRLQAVLEALDTDGSDGEDF